MRAPLLVALALFGAAPAWAAEEPSGCDKFKWPIDHERAALTAPDRAKLTSGSEQAALPATGVTLALVPPADAKLPTPPEASLMRSGAVNTARSRSIGHLNLSQPLGSSAA